VEDAIIRVRDISVRFGSRMVLDHLDLDIRRGEILGFVGASGAGKSVLMRTVIGLVPKLSGTIEVLGVDMDAADAGTPCSAPRPLRSRSWRRRRATRPRGARNASRST